MWDTFTSPARCWSNTKMMHTSVPPADRMVSFYSKFLKFSFLSFNPLLWFYYLSSMDDVRSILYVLCLSILFLAHFRLGCPYLKEVCNHKIGHTSLSHQHPKVIHERLLHDGIIAPPSVIIFNVLSHRYLQFFTLSKHCSYSQKFMKFMVGNEELYTSLENYYLPWAA